MVAEALEATAEYTFRAATPQARLLWQWKIRALAEALRRGEGRRSASKSRTKVRDVMEVAGEGRKVVALSERSEL